MWMVYFNCKIVMVVGEVFVFELLYCYSYIFKMINLKDDLCMVIYELCEKDGGIEFDLIIENVIEGSELYKQMIGVQDFIVKNFKKIVEIGKFVFSGIMVIIMLFLVVFLVKKE